ncbi:MAG: acyl-CoA dehydrogenase family protein [Syntrophales bacterium]
MDFIVPEEVENIRKMVRRFVESEIDPISLEIDKNECIPGVIIEKMRGLGFFGLLIPQEYGGLGLSMLEQCLFYEELARTNACIRTFVGSNNGPGVGCIIKHGTEEQKKKYLPPLARGEKIAAFAVSEADTGSDVSAIRTTAERNGDNFVLRGTKCFVTMGDVANLLVVLAYTDKNAGLRNGMTAFIVEKNFPGCAVGTIDEKMGLRGSNTCEIVLEDCVVPAANVIGDVGSGFKIAMRGIDAGRLSIAAVAVGSASKLMELSIEYAKQREVFGAPISRYQAIQFKLADMATDIFAAQNMLYHAAWLMDQGQLAIKESAMTKVFATEMANRVAYEALQIHGGMGYMKELGIERMCRDVRVLTIYEGTSEIQRLTIAQKLLK